MPWIQTRYGDKFDFLAPELTVDSLSDIAHSLSNLCRFTGHTKRFYSVAQHSCHAHDMAPDHLKAQALMHDAHEAYVGDVATPLKSLLLGWHEYEAYVAGLVRQHFGLPPALDAEVKVIDLRLLMTEKDQLLGRGHHDWPTEYEIVERFPIALPIWDPTHARVQFTLRALTCLPW